MKIRVSFTIDIDPESWTMNYGVEGAAQIREDVKSYAKTVVRESFVAAGIDVND